MTTNNYDLTDAQVCMTLSSIAYAGTQQAVINLLNQPGISTNGEWSLEWYGSDDNNVMYMANKQQTAEFAIAIRGTVWEDFSNVLEDLDVFHTTPWMGGNVSNGILAGLQNLVTILDGNGNSILTHLQQHCFSNNSVPTIYITGHSLGGALATALSMYLNDYFTVPVNWMVYTFASPTVGDQDFANSYNSAFSNTGSQAFRIYNTADVVPFVYSNLPGIMSQQVPVATTGHLEIFWDISLFAFDAELVKLGISYTQVGPSVISLDNSVEKVPPYTSLPPAPVSTSSDFGLWFGYEHSHQTYLQLLGANPLPGPLGENHTLVASATL